MVMAACFRILNDLVLLEFYCVYVPCFAGILVPERTGWHRLAVCGVMQ